MTDRTLSQAIDPIVRVAWILWVAFVLAMVVYGVVPYFLVLEGEAVIGLGTIFWTVGGALAIAAFLYRRWAFSDETLRRAAGVEATPGVRTGLQPPPSLRGLTPGDRRLVTLARHALRHQVVALALIEAIAVLGFLHALLSRDESAGLPFVAAAMALALLSFPRVREVVERGKAWG